MSSPDFQIAMARLIASPQLCEQVLADEKPFFSKYVLSEKEQKRLHAVLRQKGISACCSLYRMNRVTPVYTQLTNTCTILGDQLLVKLLEEFWLVQAETTLQFRDEVLEFGRFILHKAFAIPFLEEVLRFEMIINELSYLPEGQCRFLEWEYDIIEVLSALQSGVLNDKNIARACRKYRIYLRDQQIKMELVEDGKYSDYVNAMAS